MQVGFVFLVPKKSDIVAEPQLYSLRELYVLRT